MAVKTKVKDLYNLDSFRVAAEAAKTLDGQAGTILPRSLEYIAQEVQYQVGQDETFLTLGIQVDNSGGYADYITSLKLAPNGDFERIGNKNQTTGKIDLSGETSSIQVYGYQAESSFTETEMRKFELENRNIVAELVTAHNMKYNEKIDTIGYLGDKKNKKYGVINYNNWEELTAADTWENLDNVALAEEFRKLIIQQRSGKNTQWYADTIIVSPELYTRVNVSDYKDYTDLTIAEKMMKDLNVKFVPTYATKDKTGEVAIALCTNPKAIKFRIPQRLQISPIHQKGWRYYFEGEFRIAGADFLEDVSVRLKGL